MNWKLSDCTKAEWLELREAGHVWVGGVEFYLHVEGVRGEGDVKIPGTKYALPNNVKWDDVYKATGYDTYDWAKPQAWFDAYVNEHGEAPAGVWWYPSRSHPTDGQHWLGGRFVSTKEALAKLGERIVEEQGSAAKS